jgi:hypothetical protein
MNTPQTDPFQLTESEFIQRFKDEGISATRHQTDQNVFTFKKEYDGKLYGFEFDLMEFPMSEFIVKNVLSVFANTESEIKTLSSI